MRHLLVQILLFTFFLQNTQSQNNVGSGVRPLVKIPAGALLGVTENDISVFKGIPYAAPPVGDFRWRPTQQVKSWDTVRDASKFCADCVQRTFPNSQTITSEDCLFLNIWTPSNFSYKTKFPVMVWIHGGGFTGGSGSGQGTVGNSFAKQGVILITINYRLGRFGHFAHPALAKEHPEEYKGSYAYMDQIAALKWIQKNITQFGGDPNNVTIFGFSAGGVSVHSLLTIPSAKGLFHKAISESGGGRDGVLTGRPIHKENADPLYSISAETIGVNFALKHGITGTDNDALIKLRSLSAQQVLDGGQENDSSGLRIYAGPILDGRLVVETAETAYQNGRQPKVPLVIGNCSAEIGGPFVNSSTTKDSLFLAFGEFGKDAKSAYDPSGDREFNEVITKFNTDWVWGEPGRMAARAFVAKNSPSYMYQFGYVPTGMQARSRYGAGHGSEVSFVFNTLNARWGNAEITSQEKELASTMNSYWINFAKTGNPNGEGLPKWPLYNTQSEEILDIELDGKVVPKPDPRKSRFNVIEKAFKNRKQIQTRGGI
jgi:para-nitrobenzyl esterase